MTFQPVVPLGGYAGWAFLNRTQTAQQSAFDESATIVRQTSYFEENIGNITTAEDLVNDRRLLEVALGAFGLDEDINNKCNSQAPPTFECYCQFYGESNLPFCACFFFFLV